MIDRFKDDYRWLSNFWPVQVEFGGMTFPSVEHAYVAAKSSDHAFRTAVRDTPQPGKVKRMGRKVELRVGWEGMKLSVMEMLLRRKFADAQLRDLLLSTGEQELVEGNDWGDTFWGVCDGEGENHLGKLLMKIRTELAAPPVVA